MHTRTKELHGSDSWPDPLRLVHRIFIGRHVSVGVCGLLIGAIVATGVGAFAQTSAVEVQTVQMRTGSTTATTIPSSRGGCWQPVWSSNAANGEEGFGSKGIWSVNNDAWSGSHGPQTIYACSRSSWYAISKQPNLGGAVETYPDSEYVVGGRNTLSIKPISRYKSITSTFSEAYPPGGGWDAAYDLWTNNYTNETMIWNQWAGSPSYWPGQAKIKVKLGGVPYHFLANGGELLFFRDTQTTSGSVDILAAWRWEVAHGYAKSTDVPTQLEYGVEVCSTNGSETFPMTGLTFRLT